MLNDPTVGPYGGRHFVTCTIQTKTQDAKAAEDEGSHKTSGFTKLPQSFHTALYTRHDKQTNKQKLPVSDLLFTILTGANTISTS